MQPPTIYDNYQTFPVGSRAAGMGGAYTALACDEAALHYNPAALACAGASRLELSANAYIIDAMFVPGAFGPDEDLSAVTYHSVPSIVGGVRLLLDGDPVDHTGRLAFGISVSLPRSLSVKADPTGERRSFLKYRGRDDLTVGEVGLGYQLSRQLALGLSVGAGLRTAEEDFTTLVASRTLFACGSAAEQAAGNTCRGFILATEEREVLAVGARAKLGLRWTPIDRLSLGLAVTTPSLDIHGSAKTFLGQAVAIPSFDAADPLAGALYDAAPMVLDASSGLSLPLRVAAGIAWSTPRFTASLDVSVNFPRDVRVAYDQQARDIADVEEGDAAIPDEVLHRTWQPNVNIGVELPITGPVVLALGAFTDLSGVATEDVESLEAPADRVHMFGGSAAVGILSRQSRGWVGLSFEGGQAESRVIAGDLTLESVVAQSGLAWGGRSTVTRWTLVGMIGSNYSFLADDEPAPAPPPKPPPR
ncbi:MAG: hypothetical protein WKG00_15420 [Polyangiaceae bacterium]